jgi:Fe-S-cluster-containing hydrogenase component 2
VACLRTCFISSINADFHGSNLRVDSRLLIGSSRCLIACACLFLSYGEVRLEEGR